MTSVDVVTATKVYSIEANSVTGGVIDSNKDLILQKPGGVTQNLGNINDGARLNTQAVVGIAGSDAAGVVETVTITDDSTDSSTWLDRVVYQFLDALVGSTVRKTFWLNEYGELRVAPARENTTAARFFTKEYATNPTAARSTTVPVVELMDDRTNRNNLWGILGDGTTVRHNIKMADVLVLGPADSIPSGTPTGTVIIRTS